MTSTHDTPTDLFVGLTPDRVLDAVEASGLETTAGCFPLNSYENRVYLVGLADGGRVIAKFYRPGRWTRAQIAEEHGFLDDLAAAEIPVCGVVRFPDGETLKAAEGVPYALFEYRPGRAVGDPDDVLLERVAMMAARIHAVGERRPFSARRTLGADDWIRRPADTLLASALLPAHLRGRYRDAAARIADAADARLDGLTPLRVHGDLHRGNLLLNDGVLQVLDLDDACTGPAVQDLWLMLSGTPAERSRQLAVLLEGYERFRPFDRRELAALDVLPAMRRIHYAGWIARRWHDPLFPRTWPTYAEPDFWAQEVGELEAIAAGLPPRPRAPGDLLADADADSGAVRAGRDEDAWSEELTDKDYFWDLD
ncbi:MAG: serine/threonine protein kinase [Deltaproteobacteria bacterium]|nr:MAG: serine/threonine protein kinase [Deltaproteobacteria bacterium]